MKKLTALAVALLMCVQSFAVVAADIKPTEATIKIYCAPDGNDNAEGSIDAPLKTLEGARAKVAKVKVKNPNTPIDVYFRGGEYKVEKTTQFTSNDSGTENAPISYKAYRDEKPIFIGATKISADAFKPINKSEWKRVPQEARAYVQVADLKKLGIRNLTRYEGFGGTEYIENVENTSPVFLYNDREQIMARWPNGTLNFADTKAVTSASEFQVDSKGRMKNWLTADNAVIFGWLTYGYSPSRTAVKEFKPLTDTVITEYDVSRGVLADRHWSVTNLLEELDVPGEFYADTKAMKLYFYPPYTDRDAKMELITNEQVMVKLDGVSDVTFEGLSFHKTRNDAFELRSCDGISFLGCEFKNISVMAIDTMWCTNTRVDGCDFISIGSTGIRIDERDDGHIPGASVDTNSVRIDLTPDNNVVNNCYFYDIATQSIIYSGAIRLHGVGNEVTRNSIHEGLSSFIHHGGNDIKINNNEMWGGLKFSKDMGMIYNGRNVVQRGNESSFNYIHDWDSTNVEAGNAHAIYDDDNLMGHNKHHNIIVNGDSAVSMSGQSYSDFCNNIVANNNTVGGVWNHGWGAGQWLTSMKNFVNQQVAQVYTLKDYQKYSGINDMIFKDVWATNVKVEENLFYANTAAMSKSDNLMTNGSYKNNIEDGMPYQEYFNDPANGDFTIRTDIEVPEELKELQKIQLKDIGIYESEVRKNAVYKLGEFKAYFPYQYTDDVDSANVYLAWEKSDNADGYILEMSDEPNFERVTYTKECALNYAVLDDLEPDKTTYYWRVKAVSNGMKNRETRMCTNDVMVFRTGVVKELDKTLLESQLAKTETVFAKLVEGTESGNAAAGTIAEGKALIERAKAYMESKTETQRNIDEMTMMLQNIVEEASRMTSIYYTDIKPVFEVSAKWTVNELAKLQNTGGTITVQSAKTGGMGVASSTSSPLDYKSLKRFRVKLTVPSTAQASVWQAIAFDSPECSGKRVLDVKGGSGFMLLVNGTTVELQIRDGVNGALVITADSPFVCGEYADVEAGVLNVGAGQRYIVNVNGETLFDYLCTDRELTKELHMSLYDTPLQQSGAETEGIYIQPLDAVDPTIYMGTKISLGNMDFAKIAGSSELSASNGEKFSKEKLPNDYTISAKLTMDEASEAKGIVFRSNQSNMNGSYYAVVFENGKLALKKQVEGKADILTIVKPAQLPETANISINAGYVLEGLRIVVAINDVELMEYVDTKPIRNHGYVGVFSKSASKIKLEQR